jgi:acyl-CoA thioesterase FadM
MADLNIGTETADINTSRFYWRIEFVRQEGQTNVSANVFFHDTLRLASGPISGSTVGQKSFLLRVPNEHAKVTGFATFFNNFLAMCNKAMEDYYETGGVNPSSGSLNILT